MLADAALVAQREDPDGVTAAGQAEGDGAEQTDRGEGEEQARAGTNHELLLGHVDGEPGHEVDRDGGVPEDGGGGQEQEIDEGGHANKANQPRAGPVEIRVTPEVRRDLPVCGDYSFRSCAAMRARSRAQRRKAMSRSKQPLKPFSPIRPKPRH